MSTLKTTHTLREVSAPHPTKALTVIRQTDFISSSAVMDTTLTSTSSSPFLDLPSEIRKMIYEYVLFCPKGLLLNSINDYGDYLSFHNQAYGLLYANKKIYNETLPVLYHINTFRLRHPTSLTKFAKRTANKDLKMNSIKHVKLELDAQLNRTRIRELKKLVNLQSMTVYTSFADREYLGWYCSEKYLPVVFDHELDTCSNEEKKFIAMLSARGLSLACEMSEMMKARPSIEYRFELVKFTGPNFGLFMSVSNPLTCLCTSLPSTSASFSKWFGTRRSSSTSFARDEYRVFRSQGKPLGPNALNSADRSLSCGYAAGSCHGGDHRKEYQRSQKETVNVR